MELLIEVGFFVIQDHLEAVGVCMLSTNSQDSSCLWQQFDLDTEEFESEHVLFMLCSAQLTATLGAIVFAILKI
jgi:hypothetical protein